MQTADRRAKRAVTPPEPGLGHDSVDYADTFTVPQSDGDDRSAEQLLRSGLEGAPASLRAVIVLAHRAVLRFRLQSDDEEGAVLGWPVVSSSGDEAVLQAESPLMLGTIVLRRDSRRRLTLSTYLRFRRPVVASALWFAVGPLHRRIAPYLLARAARA